MHMRREQPVAAPAAAIGMPAPASALGADSPHQVLPGGGDDRTRTRVVQLILRNGPSTVGVLADELGLTAAAVRRHLDHLLAEGIVSSRSAPARGQRGRGRPAKEFLLTDSGRDRLHHAYDALAVDALRFLADHAGPTAVLDFARSRVAAMELRCADAIAAAEPGERPRSLAAALSVEGFAATARTAPGGAQLCQQHCPVAHVAAEFPQLCEAETEAFARLLGTHVQRLATIAHGDGVCTTHVPHAPPPTDRRDPLCPTA
jgi:predicted ArsR family transcriptional regulator